MSCDLFQIYNDALYNTLRKCLSDIANQDLAFAWRAFTFDATTKNILGLPSSSRPGTYPPMATHASLNFSCMLVIHWNFVQIVIIILRIKRWKKLKFSEESTIPIGRNTSSYAPCSQIWEGGSLAQGLHVCSYEVPQSSGAVGRDLCY